MNLFDLSGLENGFKFTGEFITDFNETAYEATGSDSIYEAAIYKRDNGNYVVALNDYKVVEIDLNKPNGAMDALGYCPAAKFVYNHLGIECKKHLIEGEFSGFTSKEFDVSGNPIFIVPVKEIFKLCLDAQTVEVYQIPDGQYIRAEYVNAACEYTQFQIITAEKLSEYSYLKHLLVS